MDSQTTTLDAHSGVILAVFIIVSAFVIWPIKIPLIGFVQRVVLKACRKLRIIGNQDLRNLSGKRLHFPVSLKTAPPIAVLLLLATTTINGSTIKLGVKGDETVKPYDVLVLFIALAYISIALDGTGGIEAVAFWVSKRGGTSGLRLFTYLYLFFLGVGSIVGNDPLILSGTPFLAYLTQSTGIEPTAWIFSEFMAANVASAVLVSSNPTNILVAGSFGLNFLTEFTKWTVLPSIIPAIINYPILLAMFWKKIPKALTPVSDDPWDKLKDRLGAVFFSTLMIVTVAILVGTSFVPKQAVEVWMVTAPAGVLALFFNLYTDVVRPEIRRKAQRRISNDASTEKRMLSLSATEKQNQPVSKETPDSTWSIPATACSPDLISDDEKDQKSLFSFFRWFGRRFPGTTLTITRLPIPLLPFAICEFILVRGLAQRGWISVFAHGFSNACTTPLITVFFFGFVGAAFLCPLAGTNIGATIILVEILRDPAFQNSPTSQADPKIMLAAIYAVAMGSNLGAFSYTFAGSLAGLLWKGLLADKGVHVSQLKFAKINMLPLLVQTTVACAIIYGELYWFA